MKKFALLALVAAASTAATANVPNLTQGLYVQGNVGYSKLQARYEGNKHADNTNSYSVAVGIKQVKYAIN